MLSARSGLNGRITSVARCRDGELLANGEIGERWRHRLRICSNDRRMLSPYGSLLREDRVVPGSVPLPRRAQAATAKKGPRRGTRRARRSREATSLPGGLRLTTCLERRSALRSGAEVRKPRVQPWNPGVGITEPALFRRTTGVGVSESRVVGIARRDAEREPLAAEAHAAFRQTSAVDRRTELWRDGCSPECGQCVPPARRGHECRFSIAGTHSGGAERQAMTHMLGMHGPSGVDEFAGPLPS